MKDAEEQEEDRHLQSIHKEDDKRAAEIRQKFMRVRSRVKAFRNLTTAPGDTAQSLMNSMDSTVHVDKTSDGAVLQDLENIDEIGGIVRSKKSKGHNLTF